MAYSWILLKLKDFEVIYATAYQLVIAFFWVTNMEGGKHYAGHTG